MGILENGFKTKESLRLPFTLLIAGICISELLIGAPDNQGKVSDWKIFGIIINSAISKFAKGLKKKWEQNW